MKKVSLFIIFFVLSYFYFFLLFDFLTKSLNLSFTAIKHFEIILLSVLISYIYNFIYKNIFKTISIKNLILILYPFLFLYISIILFSFNLTIHNYRFSNPLGLNKHIFGFGIFLFAVTNYFNISFLLRKVSDYKKQIIIFLIIIFILYTIIGFWTTIDGDGGDEWVYRVMAESFALDFDFNLANNLEEKYWYPGIISILGPNQVYTKYYPLYSIFISPVFHFQKIVPDSGIFNVFQNIGSPIVPFKTSFLIRTYNILPSLLSILCIIFVIKNILNMKVNFFFLSVLLFLTPYSIYATQIYPEVFSGFFTALFFIIFYRTYKKSFALNKNNIALFLIPLVLCWTHPRFFFIVLLFLTAIFLKLFFSKKYFLILLYIIFFVFNIFLIYLYQKDIPSDQNLSEVIVNGIFNFFNYNRIKLNAYLNLSNHRQSITYNFPVIYFLLLYYKIYKKSVFYSVVNLTLLTFILFMIFQPIITGAGHASPALRFYVYLFPLIITNLYYLSYNVKNKLVFCFYIILFSYSFFNSFIIIFFQRLRYVNILSYFFH